MVRRGQLEEEWFPSHLIEASTRQNYTYLLNRYILPNLGKLRMVEILPSHIRDWINQLHREGVHPPTIQHCKMITDAIFTTALNDQITFLHPRRGVKTFPVATRPRRIITAEKYLHTLPDTDDTAINAFSRIRSGAGRR